MKTRNTFSISFFLKKDKDKVKNGFAPLYASITVNGDFKDLATKRKVEISAWNQREQKLSGKADENISVREKIRLLTNEVNTTYDELRHANEILTAEMVKTKVDGGELNTYTLLFLMNYHNVELKSLIEEGTLKNYRTTERFLMEFLINKNKKKDIYLSQINYKFITDFRRAPNWAAVILI